MSYREPPTALPVPAGQSDDAALMAGISRRDPTALQALYDRYSPVVFACCLRSLKARSDAEDLLLDVFWEVWDRHDRYDAARGLARSYILGITRSRIIDRLRSRDSTRRRERSMDREYQAAESGDGPEALSQVISGEERQMVSRAMQTLAPEQRTALEMAFFDAMTHSQIAERLDKPLGTIKSRIRQALERLREALSPPRA